MKNRCVIVAGGDCFDVSCITENDYVIAADSGLRVLQKNDVRPHLIVGDFDSFDGVLPNDVETVRLPTVKDDTDLLFAAKCGIERGFNDFLILGGYGSRPDQNFAMYSTLLWLVNSDTNIKAKAVSKGFEVTVITASKYECFVASDEYLSVFSFGGEASGVSIAGADYELQNATLSPAFPVGVSNCNTLGGKVTVSVKSGNLLIFKLKKDI